MTSKALERSVPAIVVAVLWVLSIVFLMAVPFGALFSIGVIPAALLLWIALLVASVRKGKAAWFTMCTIPPLLVVAMLLPYPARSATGFMADLVRVVLYRGTLQAQLEALPKAGPNIAVVNVDGFGSMSSGLAYDPSRTLDRPLESHDQKWRAAFDKTELSVPDIEIRHVVGAYYAWFHP